MEDEILKDDSGEKESMYGEGRENDYLGERSLGHQDPGATSMYLILKALHDAVAD